jgi:tripartite-type tricarboxylate transporter receptor subunit TctC
MAVAAEQHFARATLHLGITPPTLAHQIKELESWARRASLADPAIANRMDERGAEPTIMSPREPDVFVAADTQKWASAVKFSGAKVA